MPEEANPQITRQPRHRLEFIDGLRGIAALVVAVGHTIGMVGPDHAMLPLWKSSIGELLIWPWLFGQQMVWLFILLSGFALYWSEESRRLSGRKPTRIVIYARRRAWRILPTYYVSLAFGFCVVFFMGPILLVPSPSLDTSGPVTIGGALSHLFLVHNLNPEWIHQINPPLWSIAVEAQLYLLFPFILLLRARWSIYGTAVALVAVVFVLNQFVSIPLFALIEWFAIGVVLAHIARRKKISAPGLFAVFVFTACIGLLRIADVPERMTQILWMVSFSALVLALYNARSSRWNIVTWAPTRWLGARSYSFYALHFPIALLSWAWIGRLDVGRPMQGFLVVFVSISLSLGASQLNYLLVERPSMKRSRNADLTKESGVATLPENVSLRKLST